MSSPTKKAKTTPKPAEPVASTSAAAMEMEDDDNDEALLYEDEEGKWTIEFKYCHFQIPCYAKYAVLRFYS